ncbi:hypothetical protein ACG0Z6_05985 [Roseateles sp. BYS180W]|uniref:Uncharacterized protein n=1 Tax=Roseateles rivi TaxID=3299028 RepID=A0ABW7FTZ2_9BURK
MRLDTPAELSAAAAAHNALGAIAPSYDLLHNIPLLTQARQAALESSATSASAVQTLLQAAEVALLNQARLLTRAATLLQQGALQEATEVVRWVHGFHLVLRRLGEVPRQLQLQLLRPSAGQTRQTLGLAQSSALQEFLLAQARFDATVLAHFGCAPEGGSSPQLERVLGRGRHTDWDYALLDLNRASAHEAQRWEEELGALTLPSRHTDYDSFIGAALLHQAVQGAQLKQPTCYTEFVALHQIPELLSQEMNDHVEQAVRELRAERYTAATEHLQVAQALLPTLVESQQVMSLCLSASDYHVFRDNLGPASGMHSLAIRYHMFRDLFNALWNELEQQLSALGLGDLHQTLQTIDRERHQHPQSWALHGLVNSALAVYTGLDHWRHVHLHMPRNCLGAGGTKSMIGVPDGLETVKRMRDAANALPALLNVHAARGLHMVQTEPSGAVARHHQKPTALDSRVLNAIGHYTRGEFPHVQDKSVCPFSRSEPPRRP